MALVRLVKLNNLQYNANRDPDVYRRSVGKSFRIQALLVGTGDANARLTVNGEVLCEASVSLPGRFDCEVSFDSAGTRVGILSIEGNGEQFTQELRLDTVEHDWVG